MLFFQDNSKKIEELEKRLSLLHDKQFRENLDLSNRMLEFEAFVKECLYIANSSNQKIEELQINLFEARSLINKLITRVEDLELSSVTAASALESVRSEVFKLGNQQSMLDHKVRTTIPPKTGTWYTTTEIGEKYVEKYGSKLTSSQLIARISRITAKLNLQEGEKYRNLPNGTYNGKASTLKQYHESVLDVVFDALETNDPTLKQETAEPAKEEPAQETKFVYKRGRPKNL
jgi:hypothetical protein